MRVIASVVEDFDNDWKEVAGVFGDPSLSAYKCGFAAFNERRITPPWSRSVYRFAPGCSQRT
jgi:hypothetical protein